MITLHSCIWLSLLGQSECIHFMHITLVHHSIQSSCWWQIIIVQCTLIIRNFMTLKPTFTRLCIWHRFNYRIGIFHVNLLPSFFFFAAFSACFFYLISSFQAFSSCFLSFFLSRSSCLFCLASSSFLSQLVLLKLQHSSFSFALAISTNLCPFNLDISCLFDNKLEEREVDEPSRLADKVSGRSVATSWFSGSSFSGSSSCSSACTSRCFEP